MIRKQTVVGRKSGTILIELNFFFMTLLIVCGVGLNCGQMIFRNMPRVLADIELHQAARYTQNILKRELSYNVASIRLSKGFNNRDQLVCWKTHKNVKLNWYVYSKMLYRKTGIRPPETSCYNAREKVRTYQNLPLDFPVEQWNG